MLIRFASVAFVLLLSACASNKPVITDSAALGPDGQPVAVPLPEGFESEYRDGLSLMEDDRLEEALEHWQAMSVNYPEYPGVWTNLGLVKFKSGDPDGAVLAYEEAEALDPTFCPVHSLSGVAYRDLGRFDDAQASYYAAIDCQPAEGRNYYNLGILLDLYRNDLEGALEYYRKARRLMPGDEKLDIWVIDLARRAGVPEEDPQEIDEWEQGLPAAQAKVDATAESSALNGSSPDATPQEIGEATQGSSDENTADTPEESQDDQPANGALQEAAEPPPEEDIDSEAP